MFPRSSPRSALPSHPSQRIWPLRPPAAAPLLAALCLCAPGLAAQSPDPVLRSEVTAGSEAERYLRVLQVAGGAPLYPWSVRGFSPGEVDRLAAQAGDDPWAPRLAAEPAGARLRLLRPQLGVVYNSGFPAQVNDGPLWSGRGATGWVSAGFSLRWGALSARLEPVLFRAQNRGFALMPNGRPDSLRLRDGDNPTSIDLPQRFGEHGYGRVDPGQSTLRLDAGGLALGVSSANQQWGPTDELPLLLGTNAAGFPHAFVGTSTPWRVGIGRLHGRVVWGSLAQSGLSPMQGHGSRRLMTGLLAVFTPRGLPGLELGGARFFHTAWPEGGLRFSDLGEPFQGIFKAGLPTVEGDSTGDHNNPDNQLASVFARWVLPRNGFEAWLEYAREDHSWDLQDFLLEPDHSSAYTLGARKVWRREGNLVSLRGELLGAQVGNLKLVRTESVFYRHVTQRQGHTERGQILGSPAAYGGGGAALVLDAYSPGGRWSLDYHRNRVRLLPASGSARARTDVVHALGVERSFFRGRSEGQAGMRASYELNRNGGSDAWNLAATLGLKVGI